MGAYWIKSFNESLTEIGDPANELFDGRLHMKEIHYDDTKNVLYVYLPHANDYWSFSIFDATKHFSEKHCTGRRTPYPVFGDCAKAGFMSIQCHK